MKLKSGCTFWPRVDHVVPPQFPPLEKDISCDIAIVGGGITGALLGFHLARSGVRAVLVERGGIAQGSTLASTGLLTYELDGELVELRKSLGLERANRAYRASFDGMLAFEPLVKELGDRCGLAARQNLYLASSAGDVDKLRAECDARKSIGIDVEFCDHAQLQKRFNIDRPAALWSPRVFEIDPYLLTVRLIGGAAERGLNVFTHTSIEEYQTSEEGVALRSRTGRTVKAKKIAITTGYEAVKYVPPALNMLRTTYALATEPLENFDGWPDRCMIWETARPYMYLRTTRDNRVIMGGEDEPFTDESQSDARIEEKEADLLRKFAQVFPHLRVTSACAWAGAFAETKDGLPYIGSLPQFPHGYFILGFGGNGILFSLLGARIIANNFLGKSDPLAELFAFDR